MTSIFDFLGLGNNSDSTDSTNSTNTGDPTSSYLGNLIDPNTSAQYGQAQRNNALMGLAIGLLGQGASRTPITFGQSLGAGLAGSQAASNSFNDNALKAAQTSNAVSDSQYKKIQGALSINNQVQLQNFIKTFQGMTAGNGAAGAAGGGAGTPGAPSSLTQGSIAPTTADALNMIAGPESGNNYFIGTGQKPGTQTLQNAQLDASGFPIWEGTGNSRAAGRYQIQPGTWKGAVDKYFGGNLDWRVPANQDAVAAKLYEDQGFSPWAPYNPVLRQQIQARQQMGLPAAPPSMGLPGQGAQSASPAAPAQSGAGIGGLTPQQYQQLAIMAMGIPGLKLPDFASAAASLPVDFAKAAQAKQLEIAGAYPIANAQHAAADQYEFQRNVTVKNPDGSYSEMPMPNAMLRTMIGQTFPGMSPGASPAAPSPSQVAGTNFATNIPQPGSLPLPNAGALPSAPSGAMPAAGAPQSAQTFDPNIWAARNKTSIGLVNGQLLPMDPRGNPIANAPGWGVPNVTSQGAQGAPQSGGTAQPATPAAPSAYGAPTGQPAAPIAPVPQAAPTPSYTIGKPIQPPMNPVYQKGAESVIVSDNDRIAKTMVPAADAANDMSSTATLIQDLLPQIATGYGANTIQSMARVLSQIGADPKTVQQYLTNPASGDVINKMFLMQSSAAVRAMGAREPGSVLQLFGRAYPSLETQPDAINLMENVFKMQAQRAQDRLGQAQQFQNQQLNNVQAGKSYSPLTNFETQFNTGTNSATNYLKAAEAMSGRTTAWKGLNPQQQTAVWSLIPAGTTVTYPDGTKGVR